MKCIKFLTSVAMLAICFGTFAQDNVSANSIYVQYNLANLGNWDDDDDRFNGFSLGYSRSFAVTQDMPLFVEVGGALQYLFQSTRDNVHDEKAKTQFLSIKVPVNLGYNWQATDKIAIAPYVGLFVRGNIYGHLKEEDSYFSDSEDLLVGESLGRYYQIGWQLGTNVKFLGKFYAGYSYGMDINHIVHDCKFKTHSFTLGLFL